MLCFSLFSQVVRKEKFHRAILSINNAQTHVCCEAVFLSAVVSTKYYKGRPGQSVEQSYTAL